MPINRILSYAAVLTIVSACQTTNPGQPLVDKAAFFKKMGLIESSSEENPETDNLMKSGMVKKTLPSLITKEEHLIDLGGGFSKSLAAAVAVDPLIVSLLEELKQREAKVEAVRAMLEFNIDGTLYGGVEDITDDTSGVAAVLNLNRIMFDGGRVNAQLNAAEHRLAASQHMLDAKINERALEIASIWIDLDRYEQLSAGLQARLTILAPLISQLDQVADAGLTDAAQVSSAERTVSSIRVMEADISEKLQQTRINFVNTFGKLPQPRSLDLGELISVAPEDITSNMEQSSPLLLHEYANYLASEADLAASKAKKSHSIVFESRVTRPFGGSDYDSKETVGFVLRKNFFDGGRIAAEEAELLARVEQAQAKINIVFKEGKRRIRAAQQTAAAFDKSIAIAQRNSTLIKEEINYLRQQLIIGSSTLDSILKAEASLYEADSKIINLKAEKYKAILTVSAALGLLSSALNLSSYAALE